MLQDNDDFVRHPTLKMMIFVFFFFLLSMQWSPTEPFVFASCSVDGNIAIWDSRLGKSPAASIKAHKADVNVITWNRFLNMIYYSMLS